jgi:transcription-repair coupling factor (superfamily II helicase)
MYQLRGRVGRSDRIAYAYFLYPQNYVLTENSEKRLQTIREFTALGSGFKIAMRDLAIRGAGDMLGTRQNGFLDTVGLDLYTKMLAEAVKVAEQGEGSLDTLMNIEDLTTEMLAESARELDIGLGIDRYIPDAYIDDASLKIEMYKKMKALRNNTQYEELKLEFEDRFGHLPEGVENLVDLMYLKNLITPLVEGSKVTKTTLEFTLKADVSAKIDVKVLYSKANAIGKFVRVMFKDAKFVIVFDLPTNGGEAAHAAIRMFSELDVADFEE